MKRYVLVLLLATICFSMQAQVETETDQMTPYTTTAIPNKDARYLLFPTANWWIRLKLDTSTGKIWIVQFSMKEENNRLQSPLNDIPLCAESEQSNGRFYLYPTKNFYNFLLMDQINGRVWQVQWGFEMKDRGIIEIE